MIETLNKEPIMSKVLLIGKDSETTRSILQALGDKDCPCECAHGGADAIHRARRQSFDVLITNPETTIDEDLALIEEMRLIRPGVKTIVLAPRTTREEVIAALRARVFVCIGAPFEADEIANFAAKAVSDADWRTDIEVLSAQPQWVSLRANCRMLTAERVVSFLRELCSELPEDARNDVMMAFREILLNAMEHGAAFNRHKVVEVAAVRTERTIVFYVRDPGTGFHRDAIAHAAVANSPDDPTAHTEHRDELGMRPGGYGILLAQGIVDELIYSEVGNEVLLIKHTA
jgi:anti-sigma regulatory factor (Ser/Thr protein kinase)/DNA-binding NarL/FixJ family response regulator